jgi:carbon dioxide concentrating mechanism protein CcmO
MHRVGSGWVTVTVDGDPGAVQAAVSAGQAEVARASELIYAGTLVQPDPGAMKAMPHAAGLRAGRPRALAAPRAAGLLETRGLAPLLLGADAMAKAASVEVAGWTAIGGALCHAVVRGDVDSVREAVEAGRAAAATVGDVFATLVLPAPSDGVESLLPQPPSAPAGAPVDAAGLLETTGYLGAVAGADAMAKDAGITILRILIGSGGRVGVLIGGPLEEIHAALTSGAERAGSAGTFTASCAVPRPEGAVVACFGGSSPTTTNEGRGPGAFGILEARSTVAVVSAVDQMMKAADVRFEGRFKAGAFYTSAVIRGDVASVRVALDVGAAEAGRRTDDVATHFIPAPLEEVGRCLLHR